MLASYGYVHTPNENVNNKDNKAIPNMNNPFGYSWLPNRRSSSNGVINLPHGAVKIANNANYMIMAAGNNPASGGIYQYAYVYRIFLSKNPYKVTFLNHNRFNGGQQGRMHVTKFVVEALKGESGTYVRFALGEALGVTWSDSYPTGYGFNDKNSTNAGFNKGPFFPSVHSGSGRSPCSFVLRPISSRMYQVAILTTLIVGGILQTVTGRRARLPFGLNKRHLARVTTLHSSHLNYITSLFHVFF